MDKSKKGFSGFVSMCSEIEVVEEKEGDEKSGQGKDSAEKPVNVKENSNENEGLTEVQEEDFNKAQKKGRVSAEGVVLAVIFVIVFFILALDLPQEAKVVKISDSSSSTENTIPSQYPLPIDFSEQTSLSKSGRNIENINGLLFEKPPIGTTNIHTVAQIRWCLREEIRLEKIKSYVNTNSQVDRYNNMVDEFNSCCSQYKYYKKDMVQARAEVEKMREQIEKNARTGFEAKNNKNKHAIDASDKIYYSYENVLKVQKGLFLLGYYNGILDGKYGRQTSMAIKSYQKDFGFPVTGKIDSILILMFD